MIYFDSWGFNGWLRQHYGSYSTRKPKLFTDDQIETLGEIITEALNRWLQPPPTTVPVTAEQVLDLFLKRLAEAPHEEEEKK